MNEPKTTEPNETAVRSIGIVGRREWVWPAPKRLMRKRKEKAGY